MPVVPTAWNHILGNLYFTTSQAGFMYILAKKNWQKKPSVCHGFFSTSTGICRQVSEDWIESLVPMVSCATDRHSVLTFPELIFVCRCLPDAAQQCRMRHTWSLVGLKNTGSWIQICMYAYIYIYMCIRVKMFKYIHLSYKYILIHPTLYTDFFLLVKSSKITRKYLHIGFLKKTWSIMEATGNIGCSPFKLSFKNPITFS